MTIKKLALKPGVNRENTRYATEGGWYECDKIRFRQGSPEKIGGWQRISTTTFLGTCRSIWNWVTLSSQNLLGIGTNLKFYIERGGAYHDVTPIRVTIALTDPFQTTSGSAVVAVTDATIGYIDGDYVTFTGATAVGGLDLNGEYQLATTLSGYSITAATDATSTASGGGSVSAIYQINVGPDEVLAPIGWGAASWGSGTWSFGGTSTEEVRTWSQTNFGEDLILSPRGGAIYYWDATNDVTTRAVLLSSLVGASDVPLAQNALIVSDISRFVFCFGTNPIGSVTTDPMLVRWSDQESVVNWTPSITNQAGGIRLSRGTRIIAANQARQEVLVWTDAALYSFQYLGAPDGWGAQLVGENVSIAAPNAVGYSNGTAYWMGIDKFYIYNGQTQPLPCDLRKHVFGNINPLQRSQTFAGTNEGHNEIWWFYCAGESTTIDSYVVFNYVENIWYYGSMARTAWFDAGLRDNPLAATYSNNIVNHEVGTDDDETGTPAAIIAHISSSQFDLEDGHNFAFINKVLPDISFAGSSAASPQVTMALSPQANSGSGVNVPPSEGGSSSQNVTRTAEFPVEEFTGQIYTRVRGRQISLKVESTGVGVTWQLGATRLDMRPDGRR
tara:strand:- start:4582 stop:6423 length:1842 start_codon:yes stop_codon:yes gene_type:complete